MIFLASLAIRSQPRHTAVYPTSSLLSATTLRLSLLHPDPVLASTEHRVMGLCLSVALWKEKLDGASRSVRGRVVHEVVAGVEGGDDCEYDGRILGDDDADGVLRVEPQKVAAPAVAPPTMGVKSGGVEGAAAAAVSGGTPVRPIWQRRVLMGVKCQLPRFSGMILYDESGRPLCSGIRDRARDQEKHATAISVLRDLL